MKLVPSLLVGGMALALGTASADSLFLKDGRYFDVPKLVPGDIHFEVHYTNGLVRIPKDMVKEYFVESAGSDYQPKNDDEAKKIAQGLVPYEGKWIAKKARDEKLAKKNADAKKKLEETKKHGEWRDRYKQATAHFEFEYTVTPEIATRYMDMFEVYYGNFAKEWGVKQPKGKKLKVCFYNNMEDYTRIGNAPGSLGYFRFVEPLELNFFYSRRDERLTLDVLFHELNHYLFHLYCDEGVQSPAWINEGLAEYYGASEWDATLKQMSVGHMQEGRLVNLMDAIDGGEMQDLRELMALPRIDALQYAWSWSLCHMMIHNPKYKDGFKKFVQRMCQDEKLKRETYPANSDFQWVTVEAQMDLFQKSLNIKDLDAFETEWYDYIKKMKVESARGYHSAAMNCVRWERPLRAIKYLEKAVGMYATNPGTYFELGELYVNDAKATQAIPMYEKSIELDPMNPEAHLKLGKALRKQADDASKERGRAEQLLAIELDPYDSSLVNSLDPDILIELSKK